MSERIQELEEQVRYHSDLYFNQNKPEITDAEFDALIDELRSLAPESAVLSEVGSVPSYGRKVQHSRPMGSLNKTKNPAEVEQWARKLTSDTSRRCMVAVSPKMDGLAVRLNYVNGRLTEAATRGNGEVGQDITDNVRAMACIPNSIASKVTCEVRGEVFMPRSSFERLNQSGENFANPRNAASGSLTAQNPAVTASRGLAFRWYDVLSDEELAENTEQQKRLWGITNLVGLEPVDMDVVPAEQFAAVAVEWESRRPGLDYEIDGLVVALVSIDDQEAAGWTGRCPEGKVAFKFKPEQKTATLLSIDVQVGRTGRCTPMARIAPTLVSGSTIRNITLHNYGRIRELGIMPGDDILIEKAGEIIPQVVRVMDTHGRAPGYWLPPDSCPVCGQPIRLDDAEVNLTCDNMSCPAKLTARIEHWLERLEILGIGSSAVNALCASGLVKDVSDLYYLSAESVSRVLAGQVIPTRLVESILAVNQIPLWQFLAALGIDNVGRTTSKVLAKQYKTLDAILALVGSPSAIDDLTAIPDVGMTTACDLINGLARLSGTINAIRQAVDILDVKDASGPLTGKSFCMTGALPSGMKRDDMAKLIEAAGGEVRSSVGKGLTYLVQAEPNSTSSKSEKAKKLGVQVIGEDTLVAMMGN